jgi:hypothetical protein
MMVLGMHSRETGLWIPETPDMKNLLTLCLFIAVLCLAWQYREASEREAAAQVSISELKAEIAQLKAEATPANAHAGQTPGKPVTKPNWIDERNRNFQSSLSAGATGQGGGKGHQPPPSPTPPSKLIGR